MSSILELKKEIATSIYLSPCTEDELAERDAFKNTSMYGIQRMIMSLEKEALYYKGEKMFIYEKWAKENLGDKLWWID